MWRLISSTTQILGRLVRDRRAFLGRGGGGTVAKRNVFARNPFIVARALILIRDVLFQAHTQVLDV